MESEAWKAVPGYALEASSLGRIRNADGVIRKQFDNAKGYLTVSIGKRGRAKVHRLVAAAFHGQDARLVRHLDGDSANNRPENLRHGTVPQNQRDSVEHGTHANAQKTHCSKGHEFTDKNTYLYQAKGGRTLRQCRECGRAKDRARVRRTIEKEAL